MEQDASDPKTPTSATSQPNTLQPPPSLMQGPPPGINPFGNPAGQFTGPPFGMPPPGFPPGSWGGPGAPPPGWPTGTLRRTTKEMIVESCLFRHATWGSVGNATGHDASRCWRNRRSCYHGADRSGPNCQSERLERAQSARRAFLLLQQQKAGIGLGETSRFERF